MYKITIAILISLITFTPIVNAQEGVATTKKERNFIRHGNDEYKNSHYRDAEISYKKALEINPQSEIAQFNLASSLMKQSGTAQADSPNNPIVLSDSIFRDLSQNAKNYIVKERSFFNLGNIAFDKMDYKQSIEMYKNALRINPDNDKTRENLRLAQLKLKEQQQNKNNNQDQQNKEQNKDNKQEQDKQDKQNQNNQKPEDNQKQQPEQQKQDKQQSKEEISDANAEKILKTMENEENATRKKVNDMKKREDEKNSSRRQIINQW